MEITATEFKINLGKYLDASNDEDIIITKNGKTIARLVGTRGTEYDPAALEEWNAKMMELCKLGESEAPAYNSGGANAVNAIDPNGSNTWSITYNGEPVAYLMPVKKVKQKRKLGFIKGTPTSEETIAALFESEFPDEDYERWLNEKW